MKHSLSIVMALGTALVLAPACKKEKAEDKATSEAKSPPVAAGEASKAAIAPVAKSATGALDFLSHMPVDTEVVISFSMKSLTSSPLWTQIGPQAMAAANKELGKVQEACGFNPLEKLDAVYIGVNTSNEQEPVLLVKGFERSELSTCIKAMAEKEGKQVSLAEDGAFTLISSEDKDEDMTIAWAGPSTMIMVPGNAKKEFLQARLDGKDGLKSNKAFVAAAAKAKQGAPIWFAAAFKVGSPAALGLGQLGNAPTGLYGSLGFKSGLDIDIGVSFADADAASSTLGMIRPLLGMAKAQLGSDAAILDKLKMITEGADLILSMSLSEADLKKLQEKAGPMMGGLGGQ